MRLNTVLVVTFVWLRSILPSVAQSLPNGITAARPSPVSAVPQQNTDFLFLTMFKSFIEGPYQQLSNKVDKLEATLSQLHSNELEAKSSDDDENGREFLGRFRKLVHPVTASERRRDRVTFGFCSLVYSVFCGMSFMKDIDMKKNCIDLPIEHYRTCFPNN